MPLNYLDFDYSEDADGTGTFDAMASASSGQLAALHAEVSAVLAWAHQHCPDSCGPTEEGGIWQYDLQGMQEVSTPLALAFDEASGQISAITGHPAPTRTTITLTISGGADFCAALRDAFGVA